MPSSAPFPLDLAALLGLTPAPHENAAAGVRTRAWHLPGATADSALARCQREMAAHLDWLPLAAERSDEAGWITAAVPGGSLRYALEIRTDDSLLLERLTGPGGAGP